MVAGRDFTDDDRRDSERVVIVSQSIAQRLFPNGDALNRQLWSTDVRASQSHDASSASWRTWTTRTSCGRRR